MFIYVMEMKILSSACLTALICIQSSLSFSQATITPNALTGPQTSPAQYLGSSSLHDVLFRTGGGERFRISSTTPFAFITPIQGGIKLLSTQGNAAASPAYSFNVTGETGLGMFRPAANTLAFATSGIERVRLSSGGNLGVNTSSPTQRVHVNGNILVDGPQATLLLGGETSGSPATGEYGIEYIDGTSPAIQHGLNFWKPFGSHDGAGGTGGFRNYILFMNNDGNIGMGVDPANINPAYKLSVCGAIRATKIKVETGWCDFVFDKDYKLMPLAEVEDFILKHKHLPEIPPGSEVETNGADLGFLVSKQMQKIEELTLYIIQLKKEMDALKNSIKTEESVLTPKK